MELVAVQFPVVVVVHHREGQLPRLQVRRLPWAAARVAMSCGDGHLIEVREKLGQVDEAVGVAVDHVDVVEAAALLGGGRGGRGGGRGGGGVGGGCGGRGEGKRRGEEQEKGE